MKKSGILNQPISALIAGLGHQDMIVIADAGLPIPAGVPRIDLALTPGIPTFLQVVDAVRQEMTVERLIVAAEMETHRPAVRQALAERFAGVPTETRSHAAFKDLTRTAAAVIRTGEYTPYANVILVAGVNF